MAVCTAGDTPIGDGKGDGIGGEMFSSDAGRATSKGVIGAVAGCEKSDVVG